MEGNITAPAPTPSTTTSTQSAGDSPGQSLPQASPKAQTQALAQTPQTSQSELFEVKVNGKTVKMTRQEVIDNASMVHAANERFNEASRLRKEYEEKQTKYAKNPLDAFLDHAKTLPPEERRKLLEEYYMREYIEPETLSKEERALREREAKISQWEKEQAERADQEKRQQEEQLTTKEREFLQSQIIEAMESSGLPKTKFFVQRMAFYMRQNLINGWQAPLPLIVKQVQNERQTMMSDLSSDASAEQLISLLGDGIINKIRAHDLQKLRDSRKGLSQSPGGHAGTGPQPSSSSGEKIYSSEVNRRLRDMRSGKYIPS